ncbi:sulfotransferase [Paraburkholderia hospita]|uniref:Sulfotransferase n=1 Tax=Paraburkholderia hospita TaxID=169430 RepID=A0ABN0FCZ0_9BURK|nr:sulfotransferase [Paraburkholderia hospita]
MPHSPLIDFNVDFLHLVRDGRDVIVSKWFFDTDFMINNEISDSFTRSFDDYVEETTTAWSNYVTAWADTKTHTIRYEDFLANPHAALGATIKTMTGVDMPPSLLEYAVSAHTKEKFAQSLSRTFKHNTFVRKGVAGDWKNHFSDRNTECFNQIAAEAMALLGYSL